MPDRQRLKAVHALRHGATARRAVAYNRGRFGGSQFGIEGRGLLMEYSHASLRPLAAALGQQLESSASAVVRLDEQILRLGRVGEGYRTRTDFQEACALRAIA